MEHGAITHFGKMRDGEGDSVQTVDLRLACWLAAGENQHHFNMVWNFVN